MVNSETRSGLFRGQVAVAAGRGGQPAKKARKRDDKPPLSLCHLTLENPLRRACFAAIESGAFRSFMVASTILNCLVLVFSAIDSSQGSRSYAPHFALAEHAFLAIFTAECLMKVVAFGLVSHRGAYLRDAWNFIDLAIVLSGHATALLNSWHTNLAVGIEVLRAFRLLRLVHLVGRIAALRLISISIMRAMSSLLVIVALFIGFILLFAIIGLEFFCGSMHQSCVNIETGAEMQDARPCGPNGFQCNQGQGYECRPGWRGPNSGITNFDNIFLAALATFQCITAEAWTAAMYNLNDASGGQWNWSYFVLLVILGSFFVMNLLLGVLSGQFTKERERAKERRRARKLHSTERIEADIRGHSGCVIQANYVEPGGATGDHEDVTASPDNRTDGACGSLSVDELTSSQPLDGSQSIVRKQSAITNGDLSLSQHQQVSSLHGAARPGGLATSSWTGYMIQLAEASRKMKRACGRLSDSQCLRKLMLVLTILNIAMLISKHHEQPLWLDKMQNTSEPIFAILFTLEMALKIYSLGPREYLSSRSNCFDCFVAVSSLLELLLLLIPPTHSPIIMVPCAPSLLMCIRSLRAFKVAKYWSPLSDLLDSLVNSMRASASLLLLLAVFGVFLALLGMHLFGGKFNETTSSSGETSRSNFDTFTNSLLTVFQLVEGEDWNELMYNGINAYGGAATFGGLLASFYFISIALFGNGVFLSLLLAVAVGNLAARDELKTTNCTTGGDGDGGGDGTIEGHASFKQRKQLRVWRRRGRTAKHEMLCSGCNAAGNLAAEGRGKRNENGSKLQTGGPVVAVLGEDSTAASALVGMHSTADDKTNAWTEHSEATAASCTPPDTSGHESQHQVDAASQSFASEPSVERQSQNRASGSIREATQAPEPIQSRATTQRNRFQKLCHGIVDHRYFDKTTLGCTVVSSITLALEDPVVEDSRWNTLLGYLELGCTVMFIIEILLKTTANWFTLRWRALFMNKSILLDLFVVCSSLACHFFPKKLAMAKIVRVLRVARLLRAINHVRGLKRLVSCMLRSLKAVGNILVLTALFDLVFVTIGLQLFCGTFYSCSDRTKLTRQECLASGTENIGSPQTEPREWTSNEFNFDNVLQGWLTLFVMSTSEGWIQLLYVAIDSTGTHTGAVANNRQEVAVYFIAYMLVRVILMTSIFMDRVLVSFQEKGERAYRSCKLDKNQRVCLEFALRARPLRRQIPHRTIQYKIWLLVTSEGFKYYTRILIVVNTLALAMKYHGQSADYGSYLDITNTTLAALFAMECLLKMFAYEYRNYFADWWNLFDFILVLGSTIDIVYSKQLLANLASSAIIAPGISSSYNPQSSVGGGGGGGNEANLFRLFRSLHLVKFLRLHEGINTLLSTFFRSFRASYHMAQLITVLFFSYATIGMQLFGKISLDYGTEINWHNNFSTFLQAALVLFRTTTGESWQLIMLACMDRPGVACDPRSMESIGGEPLRATDQAGTGSEPTCGIFLAIPYFISFFWLSKFLIINLFVSIIMDNFDYLTRDESILGAHHLEQFVRLWSEHDSNAEGRLEHTKVVAMLRKILPPLGLGAACPHQRVCRRLIRMNMPLDDDGKVNFNATLFALVRTALDIKLDGKPEVCDRQLRASIRRIWKETTTEMLDEVLPRANAGKLRVGRIYAALMIQDRFRRVRVERERKRRLAEAVALTRRMDTQEEPTGGSEVGRSVSIDLGENLNHSFSFDEPTHWRRQSLFGAVRPTGCRENKQRAKGGAIKLRQQRRQRSLRVSLSEPSEAAPQ